MTDLVADPPIMDNADGTDANIVKQPTQASLDDDFNNRATVTAPIKPEVDKS